MCAGATHILQSVCFEPKAHIRLCTTLNIALGSVVPRGRSALKHFLCPLDHSGTACWLLRVESCALELHTSSKCVFRAQSPQPIVHDPQYSTRIGCPKRPKRFETLSMSIGPFWYRMVATSSEIVCGGAAHILKVCVSSPKPTTDCARPSI